MSLSVSKLLEIAWYVVGGIHLILHNKEFRHIGDRLEEEAEEDQDGPDNTHLLGGVSSPFKLRGETDDDAQGEAATDPDDTTKEQQRKQIGPKNELIGQSSESPSYQDSHEPDE